MSDDGPICAGQCCQGSGAVNGPSVTYMFYPAAGVNAVLPGPVALQGSAFTSAVKGPGLCFYQCCQWTGAVLQGSAVKGPGLCCRAVLSKDRGCAAGQCRQWTGAVNGPSVIPSAPRISARRRCRPQWCTGLSCCRAVLSRERGCQSTLCYLHVTPWRQRAEKMCKMPPAVLYGPVVPCQSSNNPVLKPTNSICRLLPL